jgi:hypothetical protein
MTVWPVSDLFELARLVRLGGDSFVVRRTLQRLDREEITIQQAILTMLANQASYEGVAHQTTERPIPARDR